MHFKFDSYENGVGIRVDSDGNRMPFEKPESFDLKEKIDGSTITMVPKIEHQQVAANESVVQSKSDPIEDLEMTAEKEWINRKYEDKTNVDIETSEIKKELAKIVRNELKKKIEEKSFVNVDGVSVLDGKQFTDAGIYFMGTIVAKSFQNDEAIIRKNVEGRWKGEVLALSVAEKESLDKVLEESFSNGELVRAAFLSYLYNTVGSEIVAMNGKISGMIKKWRLANGLPENMQPAEKKALADKLMAELSLHQDMISKFVSLRKKKPEARLNGDSKREVLDIISNFIKKEFFVEKPKNVIINLEKEKAIDDIVNIIHEVVDLAETAGKKIGPDDSKDIDNFFEEVNVFLHRAHEAEFDDEIRKEFADIKMKMETKKVEIEQLIQNEPASDSEEVKDIPTVFEFLKQSDIDFINDIVRVQYESDMKFIEGNSQAKQMPEDELRGILNGRLLDVASRAVEMRGLKFNDLEKKSLADYVKQSLL